MSKFASELERRQEEILFRWERAVAADADSAPRDELRTRIPGYLQAISSTLRRDSALPTTEPRPRQPYLSDFSVESLVRQYGMFRDVVLDLMEETGVALTPAEVRSLTTFVANAIADGVSDHVRQNVRSQRTIADAHGHAIAEGQQQLLSSETKLRRVVESSGTGTWELDLVTQAVVADARHRAILGISLDKDLVMSDVLEVFHVDDRERVTKAVAAAAAGENGGDFLIEVRTQAPGALHPCWFEARGHALLGSDGARVRLIGTSVDITPRKRLDAELEASRLLEASLRFDAERANAAKDQMLALLGHELRNPLAPIMSALQLIRIRGIEHSEREWNVIERQAGHLVHLLDDMLDVSRITSGRLELKKERIELAEIVNQAIALASPILEARQHQLVVEVADQGLAVDVDRARMTQVLRNILENAAKYTKAGGTVTVSAQRSGDAIAVRVQDTGEGIASELLPTVFDMFVQERQASDRAQGGLGLGLAIVQRVVSLHNGTVQVRSEGRGRGSEFTVRLPPAAPLPTAVRETSAGSAPAARMGMPRILIVDDNEDAAELLALTLQARGHITQVALDGPAALEGVLAFAPDVALLDLGLPGMDGCELAQRLRMKDARLRLIALTGYGADKDRERTHAAGFDAHLVKPVDLKNLEATIRSLTSVSASRHSVAQ